MTTETKQPTAEEQWQDVIDGGVRTASEILSLFEEHQDEETTEERKEEILREVHEWPLSVEVRTTAWRSVGSQELEPDEFQIVLGMGGPAMRIHGSIDAHGEPCNPTMEVQDWFKPWTECDTTEAHEDGLAWFCSEFYFGEG